MAGCVPVMTRFPFSEEVFEPSGLVADDPMMLAELVSSLLNSPSGWDELQRRVLNISEDFGLNAAVASEITVIKDLMDCEISR